MAKNVNVALLQIKSKFDEQSAKDAANQARKSFDKSFKDIGNINLSDEIVNQLNNAVQKINNNRLKKVNISEFSSELLDAFANSKDVDEITQAVEKFVNAINALDRAAKGNAGILDNLGYNQLKTVVRKVNELSNLENSKNEKVASSKKEAEKIAKKSRSITDINQKYSKKDYSKQNKNILSKFSTDDKGQTVKLNSDQTKSIEKLSQLLGLYNDMKDVKPDIGSKESITYAKDLLTIVKEINTISNEIDLFSNGKASEIVSTVVDSKILNENLKNIDDSSSVTLAKNKYSTNNSSVVKIQKDIEKKEKEINDYLVKWTQISVDSAVAKAEGTIATAQKKSKQLQDKLGTSSNNNNQGNNGSIVGVDNVDLLTLDEIEKRLNKINQSAIKGNASNKQLKEYIRLYKQYLELIESTPDKTVDNALQEEYNAILSYSSEFKQYANQLDNSRTEQLLEQENQVRQTVIAEEKLIETEKESSGVNQENKKTTYTVDAEEAFSVIEDIKGKLEEIPNEKTTTIKVETSDEDILDRLENANKPSRLVDNNQVAEQQNKIQEELKETQKTVKDLDNVIQNVNQTHLLTDKFGNLMTLYRGVRNTIGAGLSSNRYHGGTFFTDNLELAKEYAEYSKVESANISMLNPLEIQGNGRHWNNIEFLGNGSDEASKKILNAKEKLESINTMLSYIGLDIEKINISGDDSLKRFISIDDVILKIKSHIESVSNDFSYDEKMQKEMVEPWENTLEVFKKYSMEYQEVAQDKSNVYGKFDTNKFVELAKNNGYDGVIFKNIIDSYKGLIKDKSNVVVNFNTDQLHNIETIPIDEFERKVFEIKREYGDISKYSNVAADDLTGTIKRLSEIDARFNDIADEYYIKYGIEDNSQLPINIQDELRQLNEEKRTLLNSYEELKGYSFSSPNFYGVYGKSEEDIRLKAQDVINFAQEGKHKYEELIQLSNQLENKKITSNSIQAIEQNTSVNSIIEDQNKIQSELDDTVAKIDKMGKSYKATVYRGVNAEEAVAKASQNYNGATHWSSDEKIARGYGTIVTSGNMSLNNAFTVDGNGADWDKIQILGDGLDENSKKAIEFASSIDKLYSELSALLTLDDNFNKFNPGFTLYTTIGEEIGKLLEEEKSADGSEAEIISKKIQRLANLRDSYSNLVADYYKFSRDTSHPYGIKSTDELTEYAQTNGYDGAIYKNIIDAKHDTLVSENAYIEASNIIVSFYESQVEYLEKISKKGQEYIRENISNFNLKTPSQTTSETEDTSSTSEQAVQSKKDFANANEEVQSSADVSKSKLEQEADLMRSIADNAQKAADAKKEFAEANSKVSDSAKETSNQLDNEANKISEVEKQANTSTQTKKFDISAYEFSSMKENPLSYFSKVYNSVDKMSDTIKAKFGKQGFADIEVSGIETLDKKIEHLTVTAKDASGVLKTFEYDRKRIEGQKNAFLISDGNVKVDGTAEAKSNGSGLVVNIEGIDANNDALTKNTEALNKNTSELQKGIHLSKSDIQLLSKNGNSLTPNNDTGKIDNSEPANVEKYKKSRQTTSSLKNSSKITDDKKKELGQELKDLQSEIIAELDSSSEFIKEVTDFYDSNDNLVKTQMKVLDKNDSMTTYTTSYNVNKDGEASTWTSHITTEKFTDIRKESEKAWEEYNRINYALDETQNKVNSLSQMPELSSQFIDVENEVKLVNQQLTSGEITLSEYEKAIDKICNGYNKMVSVQQKRDKETYDTKNKAEQEGLAIYDALNESDIKIESLSQMPELSEQFKSAKEDVDKLNQQLTSGEITLSEYKKAINEICNGYSKMVSIQQKRDKETYDTKNKAEQSAVNKALNDQYNAYKKIQDIREKIARASSSEEIEALEKNKKIYQEQIIAANKVLKAHSDLYDKEAQTAKLEKVRLETSAKIANYKNSESNKADKRQVKVDSMISGLGKYEGNLKNYQNRIDSGSANEPFIKKFNDYSTAYTNYEKAIENARTLRNNNQLVPDEEINNLEKLKTVLDEAEQSIKSLSKTDVGSSSISRNKLIVQMNDYLKKNSGMSKEFKAELNDIIAQVKKLGASADVSDFANQFLKLKVNIHDAGQEGKSFLDIIKNKAMYGLAAQIGMYFGINDIVRYIREGISIVGEYDDALSKISYTMDITKSQLDDLGSSVLDLASDMKASISDAMQVAQIYANMNTTAEEIQKLSQPTLILSNLTGFDAETVANDIQAVNQQFEIAAEDAMQIADIYDYISRNVAVDYSKGIEGMASGIQIVGSTAKQAGKNKDLYVQKCA